MTTTTNTSRPCREHVHLIGLGDAPARRVRELLVGDLMVWNYGYASEVLSLEPRGSSVAIVHRCAKTGETYTSTKRASTLVAVASAVEYGGRYGSGLTSIDYPPLICTR